MKRCYRKYIEATLDKQVETIMNIRVQKAFKLFRKHLNCLATIRNVDPSQFAQEIRVLSLTTERTEASESIHAEYISPIASRYLAEEKYMIRNRFLTAVEAIINLFSGKNFYREYFPDITVEEERMRLRAEVSSLMKETIELMAKTLITQAETIEQEFSNPDTFVLSETTTINIFPTTRQRRVVHWGAVEAVADDNSASPNQPSSR